MNHDLRFFEVFESRAAVSRQSDPKYRGRIDVYKGRSLRLIAVVLLVAATSFGCVRRTIRISTEPPNALVYLNDQEIGRSEVTTDFLWYGDYEVIIRKEGYQTLYTNWDIKPPWYQILPIDFFAEVLWPGQIHDVRSRHFVMQPQEVPATEELIERAQETRNRALDARR